MIVLGLDLSSSQCSLALMENETVLVESQWEQTRGTGQRLFQAWPEAMREAGIQPAEIDLYVCGRGPGSFSGVRISLAAARAAALPGGRPVIAIASGEALARSVAGETAAQRIIIVGDARRDTIWMGEFERTGTRLRSATDWKLVTPADFHAQIGGGAVCATSQWDRMRALLGENHINACGWIEGDRFPPAREIARAGLHRHMEQSTGESLTPLYLHPAVRI